MYTLLVVTLSYAQLSIEEFDSFKLNEKRKVSLFVPENYSKDKKYPLVVVLDADYLFDVVVLIPNITVILMKCLSQ